VTVFAQIPLTPPADSPAGLLGWAVAIVMAGAIVIWRLREKERTAQMVALQTRLEDREKTIIGLGDKLDLQRKESHYELESVRTAHADHVRRVVIAIGRRSTPRQAARGASEWEELPTDVRDVLDLVAGALAPPADPFADLEGWRPDEKTPPETPAPRPRMPSRPR
jgi:hypothetical protein